MPPQSCRWQDGVTSHVGLAFSRYITVVLSCFARIKDKRPHWDEVVIASIAICGGVAVRRSNGGFLCCTRLVVL